MEANIKIIALPNSKRKQTVTHDVSFRVWKLHKRFNHVSLETLAHMSHLDILGDAEATYQEIILVAAHQDCYSCALSKWRRLSATPLSGLLPTLTGKRWSMDYKGPYATLALGGYKGKFVFIDRSCGYCVVFLVKSKK